MLEADLPIDLVAADRKCRGLSIAADAGIETALVERTEWTDAFDRDAYSAQLVDLLTHHEIDVVAMAGFGTVLGPIAFDVMPGRIINTHPALLPSFKGWHAVKDALAYGVKVTGCTIHVATALLDEGPILAQEAVRVLADDDEATLHERIKTVERRLYVETLRAIAERGHVLDAPI